MKPLGIEVVLKCGWLIREENVDDLKPHYIYFQSRFGIFTVENVVKVMYAALPCHHVQARVERPTKETISQKTPVTQVPQKPSEAEPTAKQNHLPAPTQQSKLSSVLPPL